MSIAESAGSTLGRKIGPLPLGGWAAIGIATIVVVKLLRGGGGGGSGTVTVPDAFAGDASGGGGGTGGGTGGGSGTTLPAVSPPAGSGSPAGAPAKYRLSITGRTHFYSTVGKLLNLFGESGTYDATIVKVGTRHFYRIKRAGAWRLIPVGTSTVKVTQVK